MNTEMQSSVLRLFIYCNSSEAMRSIFEVGSEPLLHIYFFKKGKRKKHEKNTNQAYTVVDVGGNSDVYRDNMRERRYYCKSE